MAIPVFYLMNKEKLMGVEYLPSYKWNVGLIAVIGFSLVTTYFAIKGFL